MGPGGDAPEIRPVAGPPPGALRSAYLDGLAEPQEHFLERRLAASRTCLEKAGFVADHALLRAAPA